MTRLMLVSAAAIAALCCTAAQAAQLDAAFKNTIVSTYPDGRQGRLWLSKGGTYTAEGRKKDRSDGKWELKGDQICLKQSHPATLPLSYCTAVPPGGVGAGWSARAVTGEPIKVKLVRGRGA